MHGLGFRVQGCPRMGSLVSTSAPKLNVRCLDPSGEGSGSMQTDDILHDLRSSMLPNSQDSGTWAIDTRTHCGSFHEYGTPRKTPKDYNTYHEDPQNRTSNLAALGFGL